MPSKPVENTALFESYLMPCEMEQTSAPTALGNSISYHKDSIPDWTDAHICILAAEHSGNYSGPELVRQQLAKLTKHNDHLKVVDLGNVRPGNTVADTQMAIYDISHTLLSESILPILISSDPDLTFNQYRAFEQISRNVELCTVTQEFELRNESYFTKICTYEPNFLFNYNILGFQSHLVDDESISAFKKMFFHPVRLGLLRNRLNEIEPVLRNTDICSIDLNAIKTSDHPANKTANPNGLTSEEICQIAWYAGISEKMRSLGVFSYNPEFDIRDQSAQLTAQILWYFIDGYYNRKGDHPTLHKEFLKYRCALEDNTPDIIFFKSKRTDRWWMQIPNPRSLGNTDNNILIPCTYSDYQTATKGDMPDRFWQALQKL